MQICFNAQPPENSTIMILGTDADGALQPTAAAIDAQLDGLLTRSLEATPSFKGKPGQWLPITAHRDGVGSVLLIATGSDEDHSASHSARQLGAKLANELNRLAQPSADIALDHLDATTLGPLLEGILLAEYRFDRHRQRDEEDQNGTLATLNLTLQNFDHPEAILDDAQAIAAGVHLARDLGNEPPNVLSPAVYAERCQALSEYGLEVEVLDEPAMRTLGMEALLAVNQGSQQAPRLVVMKWNGGPDDQRPVALVGKGVTFDSGGISIKPAAGMDEMKFDMAGSAAVVGTMRTLAGRKAPINVVGIIGLVENMPSGSATRPGDIIGSMAGKSIEVLNTDAEGRLVLADALCYAQKHFDPVQVINLATLTGAIIVALGSYKAGLFCNDDTLRQQLLAAAEDSNEPLWAMPLGKEYSKELKGSVSDLRNIGAGRYGGAITAAAFLQAFIDSGRPWAHLDIAGVANGKKHALGPEGATGFGVRLLDTLLRAAQ